MALSTVGTVYGTTATRIGASSCPTCGQSAVKTAQAYSSYAGRSDSYYCATCGKVVYGSGNTSCPTCNKTSGANTAGVYGKTSTCPTCSKSGSAGTGSYTTTTWTGAKAANAGSAYGVTAGWAR